MYQHHAKKNSLRALGKYGFMWQMKIDFLMEYAIINGDYWDMNKKGRAISDSACSISRK
jgi:hypothetical protein